MESFPAQLDLFIDSRAVVLANEVISALLARDVSRSVDCLDEMRRSAPDHPRLPALETLVQALAGWQAPSRNRCYRAPGGELEDTVGPAAEVALEKLRFSWRILA
jgi:hypothetical protein